MEHLGHFVQRPSGISRFLDFEAAIFGFFGKAAADVADGGVTANSGDSRPSDFLVKDVVAIIKKTPWV